MKHKVLLVDDSPIDRTVYRTMLAQNMPNLQIDEADGPVAAVRKLRERRYDCVFLDYEMEGGTGLSVLEQVQSFNKSPIVMLTSTADVDIAVTALRAGALDFLVKGEIAAEHLVNAVQEAVMHRLQLQSREQSMRRLKLVHTVLLQSAELILIIELSTHRLVEASTVGLARIGIRRVDVIDKDVRTLSLWGPAGFEAFAAAVAQAPTPLPTAQPGVTLQARAQTHTVEGEAYLVVLARTVPA